MPNILNSLTTQFVSDLILYFAFVFGEEKVYCLGKVAPEFKSYLLAM